MRIVVMGPSGSGKTVIGKALAERLEVPFADADDLHPPANVAKMASGHPLDDSDRGPWLDAVGAALGAASALVVACSALARRYRDRIRAHAPDAVFVELAVSRAELAQRMRERAHFMPPQLLDSQFAAWEPLAADERGVRVSNEEEPGTVVTRITQALEDQSLR